MVALDFSAWFTAITRSYCKLSCFVELSASSALSVVISPQILILLPFCGFTFDFEYTTLFIHLH